MACTHGIWAGSDMLKSINRIHEFPLWKYYIQDVPQKQQQQKKKQYPYFFGGAPRVSRVN